MSAGDEWLALIGIGEDGLDGLSPVARRLIADADASRVDMATLVLVGSSGTRLIPRESGRPWVYTPRGAA